MNQPTTVDKLRGLPWSISANVANAIFCQFTFFGSVFPLFLSELGFSKSQMGFLFSLMPFCGLIAPLIAPATLRFGYKNTYMTFWGIRKIVTALLLLTPWLLITFGPAVGLLAISTITAVFALCRAIAETARVPWVQEFVPGSVQGKYTAMSNIFTSLAGFLSVLVAGYVLGQAHNLTSFMLLIAGGVFFGFICVWLTSFIPGGAPVVQPAGQKIQRNLGAALRDRNLLLYLGGVGLIVIATTPIGSFLPLFMREQVGLDAGSVVNLQLGSLLGGLITSYLWGWAADRYGSKPVMLIGLNLPRAHADLAVAAAATFTLEPAHGPGHLLFAGGGRHGLGHWLNPAALRERGATGEEGRLSGSLFGLGWHCRRSEPVGRWLGVGCRAAERRALHRDADDGQHGLGSHHAWQMGGAARSGHHDLPVRVVTRRSARTSAIRSGVRCADTMRHSLRRAKYGQDLVRHGASSPNRTCCP